MALIGGVGDGVATAGGVGEEVAAAWSAVAEGLAAAGGVGEEVAAEWSAAVEEEDLGRLAVLDVLSLALDLELDLVFIRNRGHTRPHPPD